MSSPSLTPSTTAPARTKDRSIESLRGLAVLLMVSGHVIGNAATRGIQVSDGSGWRFFYQLLEDVRMPLFTVISGYVYAYRPLASLAGYSGLVKGKARRLLVPLLTVGLLWWVLQAVTPGTNTKIAPQDAWRVWVFGSGHLWFLQSIFVVFLVVGLLTATGLLSSPRRTAVVIGAGSLLYVLVRIPDDVDVFSVGGAIRLLPFFVLGFGIHRWGRDLVPSPALLAGVAAAAAGLLALRSMAVLDVVALDSTSPLNRLLSVTLGLAAVSLVMLLRSSVTVRPLAWLGGFSFGIYLLHVFGSAGSRVVLNRFGLDSEWLQFTVGMICAVGLPVLAELVLGRYAWFSWSILGQRPRRRTPRTVPSEPVTATVSNGDATKAEQTG